MGDAQRILVVAGARALSRTPEARVWALREIVARLDARVATLEARPVGVTQAAPEPAKKPDPIGEIAAKIAAYARSRRTVVTTSVELRVALSLGEEVSGSTIAAAIKRIAGGAFPGVTAAHTGETVLPNHGRAWLWTLTAAKAVA